MHGWLQLRVNQTVGGTSRRFDFRFGDRRWLNGIRWPDSDKTGLRGVAAIAAVHQVIFYEAVTQHEKSDRAHGRLWQDRCQSTSQSATQKHLDRTPALHHRLTWSFRNLRAQPLLGRSRSDWILALYVRTQPCDKCRESCCAASALAQVLMHRDPSIHRDRQMGRQQAHQRLVPRCQRRLTYADAEASANGR